MQHLQNDSASLNRSAKHYEAICALLFISFAATAVFTWLAYHDPTSIILGIGAVVAYICLANASTSSWHPLAELQTFEET